MTTILASPLTCPPGCVGHLAGGVHMSAELSVPVTAYATEQRELYVSLERDDDLGRPVVRLMGANDAPMTPAQALQLAAVLTAQAFAAVTSWTVTR